MDLHNRDAELVAYYDNCPGQTLQAIDYESSHCRSEGPYLTSSATLIDLLAYQLPGDGQAVRCSKNDRKIQARVALLVGTHTEPWM